MRKAIAAAFLLLTLLALSGCIQPFLYHPTNTIEATPDQVGLAFEAVTFKTQDGLKLYGWWIPANPERGVILFCHGNAGNISHRLDSILIFHKLGMSVFIFDYRGYGLSEGRPTESGTYRDADAAWDYLLQTRRIPPERIIPFGRSLGGAIAAHVAASRPSRALIVESAFTSLRDIAKDHLPWVPDFFLAGYRYHTLESVREFTKPILVVHSPEDEIIPFKHGLTLYRAAQSPKQFLEIHGSHNGGFMESAKAYEKGLRAFLDSVFTGSESKTWRMN